VVWAIACLRRLSSSRAIRYAGCSVTLLGLRCADEIAMNRFHALILLLPVVSLTLACGSSNRRLQSVSMTRTANGQPTEFVATGNFFQFTDHRNVDPGWWSVQLMAPPPRQYTLTTPPFLFDCTASGPFPIVRLCSRIQTLHSAGRGQAQG
jgi:hypothetical protein